MKHLLPTHKHHFAKVLAIVSALWCYSACRSDTFTASDVIAQVGDRYLYSNDVPLLPENPQEDSLFHAKNFINNWVSDRIFFNRAKTMLSTDEKKKIAFKIRSYEEHLIGYAYKIKMLKNFKDTLVSQDEIEAVYDRNKNAMKLRDDLIRVVYVFLDKDSKLTSRVKQTLPSIADSSALTDIQNICYNHSKKFHLDRAKWFMFSNLSLELPFLQRKHLQRLRFDRVYHFSHDQAQVICHFLEVNPEGKYAPLSYVKDKIKTIVINRRKLQFIEQLKRKLYKETLQNKAKYEIFIKE